MPRSLTMAAFLIAAAAALACSSSPTSDESLSRDPSRLQAARSCTLTIAGSCPAGCFEVGAHPMDRQNSCLLPLQPWECSAMQMPGPPSIGCSVTPDGTIWVSMESRVHPQGRRCTAEEYKEISFSKCP